MKNDDKGAQMGAFYFSPPVEDNFFGHICCEIYKDKVYDPYLRGRKDLTILDLGMNVGVFTYFASQFAKRVYGVEPSIEHFACAARMIEENGLVDKVTAINAAVGKDDGTQRLYHTPNKSAYSLFDSVIPTPMEQKYGYEEVITMRLDTMFKEYDIKHIDFMKIDIEGSEFEVLGGAGFANVADKIDMIFGELHAWAHRNVNQIKQSLQERGFDFEFIPHDANLFVARRKK